MAINHSNSIHERHRRAVGVFPNRRDAEQALYELRDSGFNMDRVSVITRDDVRNDEIAGADVHDSVRDRQAATRVDNKADDGAKAGAATGGALGGLTGLLVGLGTLAIPGVGPIMLAGAAATALATTLAGTAIGAAAGGILGALIGLGIPEERARVYGDRVSRGEYLVIVDGTDAEIAHAERILHSRGIQEYGVYDAPAAGVAASANPLDRDRDRDFSHHSHAVGAFSNRQDAELAVADLQNAGFPLSQISLIARNFDRRDAFRGADLHDRFDAVRYGIPVEQARLYNNHFERGDYLVVVRGTDAEIRQAESILRHRGIQGWQIFAPAAAGAAMSGMRDRDVATSGTYISNMPTHSDTHVMDRDRMAHQHKRAIGVFEHRRDAETALTDLRDSGFLMDRVSIIGKDAGRHDPIAGVDMDRKAGNKADEGAKTGAATGAALGGLGGLLVGLGTLAIPGIGPVLLGGAAATALATAVSGGAIGAAAGGIAGGLVGLGIPEDRARVYNDRLNRGDYLVMVDGDRDEVHRAEGILKRHGIREWDIYDASDVNTTHRSNVVVDRPDPTVTRTDRVMPGEAINDPDIVVVERRIEPL